MTPEALVQDKIKKWLEANDILFFRRQAGGGNSYRTGIPDLYGVHLGLHFEIETKSEDGKLSSAQYKWRKTLLKHGSIYISPKSFEEFLIEWKKYFN